MKRKIVWLIVTMMIISLFAGCGQSSGQASAQKKSDTDKEIVVGIPKVTQSFAGAQMSPLDRLVPGEKTGV